MSEQPIGTYSFLSWARQGLGARLLQQDQDTTPGLRASITVPLRITADRIGGGQDSLGIPKSVEIYGPGDITGIQPTNIFRTEPRHWTTDFEANYLPFVEFYEEDFCWRYTPAGASPDGRRIRPWLALVVLEEHEFTDAGTVTGASLPAIDVIDPATSFPRFEEHWAWAHVHVNSALEGEPDNAEGNAARFSTALAADRDVAYSRLLCPRALKTNTAYHAFVIPSYESGRLAGLAKDPTGAAFPTQGAWVPARADTEPNRFPVYHRWYFRTGAVGDFEYLVRLLKPRTVDPQVGRRPLDVQVPGANLPAIKNLGGILRLGGALRAPLTTFSEEDLAEYEKFEAWAEPYPHPFQEKLAALVNLASDYTVKSPGTANADTNIEGVTDDEDPLIVPPLYGRWHAQRSRLVEADADPDHERWVHELNLDPRHRVAAGLGTGVVQRKQEDLMEAAWQQVGNVLEGNAKIRFGQMALLTSLVWHRRDLKTLWQKDAERLLALTAPVQRRVLASGLTLAHRVRQSTVPPAIVSTTMRQVMRPRGRVSRLLGFIPGRGLGNLITRINAGEVSAAPPKVIAPGLPTGPGLADQLVPEYEKLPSVVVELIRRVRRWRLWLLVIVILLILFVPAIGILLAIALFAVAVALWPWIRAHLHNNITAEMLDPETRTPRAVDELPGNSGFSTVPPNQAPPTPIEGKDSPDAGRFKDSLRRLYAVDLAERSIVRPPRDPLDLPTIAAAAVEGLDPRRTVPARILGSIQIPGRIADQLVEDFGEVMVYPEIDTPMYEPLKDWSSEFFLPNIQLLRNNSITLLETNQKFIEAYMVGLNHEFARELLWREYPTDQRGSYFRQFWDITDYLAQPGLDPAALRERLHDIPELHHWATASGLGTHDYRKAQGDKEEEVVLTIRGDLLKKYPTAVIYAHKAEWEPKSDGTPDKTKPRNLADLPPGIPPRTLVRTPLYEAKVDPDIYFFGFDLTAESARGGSNGDGLDDPGWFFVIKERPGEPRFGLDVPQENPSPTISTWNELSWSHVAAVHTPGEFLRLGERSLTLTAPPANDEARPQYEEDKVYKWRTDTQAAELAYILYQVPALIAVHAVEMLESEA
ncbi:hypothetical protein [Arthrobacter ruber]|uniref:hypothetical protein n=1 Tax=Arthrobacter ruber TaxID=1258893 RepID=UPI000CF3D2F0|nr:hypothetical protein [Arthrobacter ruber]